MDKEQKRLYNKLYYLEHRENLRNKHKLYEENNKDKRKSYDKKYRLNKDKLYLQFLRHTRECKELGLSPTLTYDELLRIFNFFNYQCTFCNDNNTYIGYIVSRQRGGNLELGNIIPICLSCRSSKKNLMLGEWNRFCIKHKNNDPNIIKLKEYITLVNEGRF